MLTNLSFRRVDVGLFNQILEQVHTDAENRVYWKLRNEVWSYVLDLMRDQIHQQLQAELGVEGLSAY